MSKRLIVTISIAIFVVVVALVATRVALSPFIVKEGQVEEGQVDIPSEEDVKKKQMAEVEATVVAVEEPMPEGGEPVALASGSFQPLPGEYEVAGEGTATIYQLPDGGYILRLENFFVTNCPGLRVYLAVENELESDADSEEIWLDMGPLKGNKGNQNYEISSDIDPGEYSSVIIWCESLETSFSVASLTK